MKRPVFLLVSAGGLVLALMLAGCGGSTAPSASASHQQAVQVAIAESPTHLGAAESYQFTATVSNAADTRITWSLSGCTTACGSISESGMFTAPDLVPSVGSVVITATPMADTTKSASVQVALMPVSVWLAPNTPRSVLPGGTQSITATLDYDPQHAGVTWTLSGAGCSGDACGTLGNVTSTSVVYRAPDTEPSPDSVTLTATSIADHSKTARVTFLVSATAFALEGKYAFLINGYESGILQAVAGQFTADGHGNLAGVWDANRGTGIDVAEPITGTYDIQPEGHGTMTIQAGSATFTYVLSLDASGASARFAEATIPASPNDRRGASGYLARQNDSSFDLSSVDGDRVIALYGEATGSHVAAVGRFTAAEGTLNDPAMDLSWEINQNAAKFPNRVGLTGSFAAPDPGTGRGTASLKVANPPPLAAVSATYHFAYYIVSDTRLLLVQTDARGFYSGLLIPTLSGEVRRQSNAGQYANASLNAPVVFHSTDSTDDWMGRGFASIRVGQIVPNGTGSLSMTFDENVGGRDPEMIGYESGGPKISLNATYTSNYSVSANGRATWSFPYLAIPGNTTAAVGYLVDQNSGYLMTQDLDGASFGAFGPQVDAPFTAASIAGTYLVDTGPPANSKVENDSGWLTLASDGTLSGTVYFNAGSGATAYDVSGTFSVAEDGRATAVLGTIPPRSVVFWMQSVNQGVALFTVNAGDTNPVLIHMQRVDGN